MDDGYTNDAHGFFIPAVCNCTDGVWLTNPALDTITTNKKRHKVYKSYHLYIIFVTNIIARRCNNILIKTKALSYCP